MMRALDTVKRPDRANCIDWVTLDLEARRKRRQRLRTRSGLAFVVDLPQAPELKDGDGFVLEDGGIVAVVAAAEPLLEITADDWPHLLRIAWHLGNRHLPTELLGERLRIRDDHVIRDMVLRLGGSVQPVEAPFDPEGGAYGHGTVHGHD